KEARSLSRDRRRPRGKVSPRSRSCFLRGPCMLCFIVHGASPPAPEQPLPVGDPLLPPYVSLTAAEQRVARRLLPLAPAAWEPPGRCQRPGACQCPVEPQLLALPGAAGECGGGTAGQSGGGQPASPPPPAPQEEKEQGREEEKDRGGEAGCEEPLESPGDSCRELPPPPTPDINQLPPSILLKIFSNLSLNERCLSVSLVCKYWRDLCLDFQFWKQLDLSSRQQVTDELLEKIASRSQNITEINISDCRNVSDTGVCILAIKCPGLLRYTAYRCKQLSDTSIIAVASQCPLLQKVHVGNQDRLTDEGLKQLGSKCRELKDIHFGQCYKISDEGMIIIAKGCLKLQRIYMQENKLVS
ncbi:FXL17 protein, partial [Gymnorhina tibicen]|nr:FXL17 protein [Gymnorhina tibicen]